jgi:hypothetical protein
VVPVQNSLKEADALLKLLFSFALEYVIGKAQENKVRFQLNGACQLLVSADDVNLLGNNMTTI